MVPRKISIHRVVSGRESYKRDVYWTWWLAEKNSKCTAEKNSKCTYKLRNDAKAMQCKSYQLTSHWTRVSPHWVGHMTKCCCCSWWRWWHQARMMSHTKRQGHAHGARRQRWRRLCGRLHRRWWGHLHVAAHNAATGATLVAELAVPLRLWRRRFRPQVVNLLMKAEHLVLVLLEERPVQVQVEIGRGEVGTETKPSWKHTYSTRTNGIH